MSAPAQVCAAALMLLLAACIDLAPQESAADPSNDSAGPAVFDETTGAVQGIVTDVALVPLASVQIALADSKNATVETDDQGVFTLNHVPPGEHTLYAQKLGYESLARTVTVAAGEVSEIELQLTDTAVSEPYHTVKIQRGLFGCGVTVRPVVGVSVCGVASLLLNQTQYDKFLLEWSLDGKPTEWKTGILEMRWDSTQAAGRALSVNWEVDDCPNEPEVRFGRATGPSPLRVEVHEERIEGVLSNSTANKGCDEVSESCDEEEKCEMMTRVFSAAELLGSGSPADAGLTFQQSFEQYESEFFAEPAPLDYTAVPDE